MQFILKQDQWWFAKKLEINVILLKKEEKNYFI